MLLLFYVEIIDLCAVTWRDTNKRTVNSENVTQVAAICFAKKKKKITSKCILKFIFIYFPLFSFFLLFSPYTAILIYLTLILRYLLCVCFLAKHAFVFYPRILSVYISCIELISLHCCFFFSQHYFLVTYVPLCSLSLQYMTV